MTLPTQRSLLRLTAVWLLAMTAVGTVLYVGVVSRWVRLGGLSRGDLIPWFSQFDPRVSLWSLAAVAAAAGLVVGLPRLMAVRRTTGFLLLVSGLSLAVWSSTALSDGQKMGERREGLVATNGLAYPFERTAHEYIGDVPKVYELGVRGLVASWPTDDVQNRLAWHSRTHPPGPVLLLWGVERTLGPGALPAAFAMLFFGALCVPVVYGLARLFLAPAPARAVTLLFAIAPNTSLFFATSMEPVFTLLSLSSLFLILRGLRPEAHNARDAALNLLAGAALAITMFFTYAAVLVVFIAGAIEGVSRFRSPSGSTGWLRSGGRIAIQLVGFAGALGALALLGWDARASIEVAMAADSMMMGDAGMLGGIPIGIANLSAWGIGVGLATLGMLTGAVQQARQAKQGWLKLPAPLVGTGLALMIAAFSTLFTLEVERIWIIMNAVALISVFVLLPGAEGAGSVRDANQPETTGVAAATLQLWAALLLMQTLAIEVLAETRW